MLSAGLLARHYGMTRTGDVLQAVALPHIFSAFTVVATVILTRYSTPFADELLSGTDRRMGLDWMALFAMFQRHPILVELGNWAYSSFHWQFVMVCLLLFASNRTAKGWRFITAWTIALIAAALLYPFFTANGPYRHFGIIPADIPNLYRDAPWTTGPLIEAIRSGHNTDVVGSMSGLVYFPSFHTAGAIMFIWAWWENRWLRWPMVLLNLAMLAATPVIGFHYFTDMVGGAIVALLAILLAKRLIGSIEGVPNVDAGFGKLSNPREFSANS